MNYMKQLDAIRAIGVSVILYYHFIGWKLPPLTFLGHQILLGITAVDSFFVLSGFLITGILLKSKDKIDCGNETVFSCLKTFYARRTLRIFPIFYLTLLVTFILNVPLVRETIWWNAWYCINVYFAMIGSMDNGAISHLWSLAVEEQFYLMWPLIILLTPRRQLATVLVLIIGIAPAFRFFCYSIHANSTAPFTITLGNIDLLGIGGLLAYIKAYRREKLPAFLKVCLFLGGPMFVVSLFSTNLGLVNVLEILTRTFEGLLICWFVNRTADGFGGVLGYLFELKPLLYLGKISYGLYLYHNFVPDISRYFFQKLHLPVPTSLGGQFLTYTLLSLMIASISWHVIEKPLSTLKDFFKTGNTANKRPVYTLETN